MRIRQLDGVRALAVLLVFAEHGFGLKMGWAGVDLFFVLSGFLITRILRHDKDEPAFWGRFYVKRATRIIPAFALCLALSALLFDLHLHKLWLAYIFFGANFAESLVSMHGPLSILWSLAVEEHFYLFWPFAVRFMKRKHLLQLLSTVLFVEPVLRGVATPFTHSFWAIYLLTPFRLDGLAAGSLLALLLERDVWKTRLARISGPLFCASMITLAAIYALTPSFKRPANSVVFNSVGYTLITIVAFSLISYLILRGSGRAAKVFAWTPINGLGQISYGVYLFHLIGFAVVGRILHAESHATRTALLALPFTIVFCLLSFRFYEAPFVRWGHKVSSRWAAQKTRVSVTY